ncbi:hypothetical protein [Streptomyces sp. NPDC001851]|uniref:hypothetical protein n=1 Tax=Streptomyces sp. NPDC001851 TaxID=3154529 RepID=UPI0033262DC6
MQIADAWHLWHNLGEAVEKTVSAHHTRVRTTFENTVPVAPPTSDDIWQTPPPPAPAAGMLDVCGRERRLVTRTRERCTTVQQLLQAGGTLENICRTLQPDRSPVRRPAPQPRPIVRWIMTDPGNLTADDAADLKEIRTSCPELDAVTAGLSTPWSSGQVEGQVRSGQATRTKLLKSQGYGRANLDFLRRRVLLTP